jgi:hypothetical protein
MSFFVFSIGSFSGRKEIWHPHAQGRLRVGKSVTSKADFLWYQEFIGLYVRERSTFAPTWTGEASRDLSHQTKLFIPIYSTP